MDGNLNPSARIALVGSIPPQQAAVGIITSAWVDMRNFFSALAGVNVGAIGAGGTIDARIEQATDVNGSNAKPVGSLAITQLAAAGGNNRQSLINLRQEDMDKNGGFRFARLSVTIGGAATYVGAQIIGLDARYGAASVNQSTTVAETVS